MSSGPSDILSLLEDLVLNASGLITHDGSPRLSVSEMNTGKLRRAITAVRGGGGGNVLHPHLCRDMSSLIPPKIISLYHPNKYDPNL